MSASFTTITMECDDEAREVLVEGEGGEKIFHLNLPRRRHSTKALIFPWTLSAFFFITTLYFGLRTSLAASHGRGSYEDGFTTDFGNLLTQTLSIIWMASSQQ
jgi:hypothetical protein